MPVSINSRRQKPNCDDTRARQWAAPALAALISVVCLALLLVPWQPAPALAAPSLQEPATPTPTPTSPPILDVSNAERIYCGGVYSGDTQASQNNVSSYGCRPWWDESGNEMVYRLESDVAQPVTVTLLGASADLDLFFLRYAYPDACLAAGDNYLNYAAQPGVYFLSVDGYRGATGSYTIRVDCPADQQATPTPTFTSSPTPTATPTGTTTPTGTAAPTVTPTVSPNQVFLPLLLRAASGPPAPTVTFTLQDGLNGYAGTTDTTLDSWEPAQAHGAENRLRLFYSRPPKLATQMAPVLRFDLNLLPAGAQVQRATLRLYLFSTPPYDLRARVQGLLRPWDESSASWELAAAGQPWDLPGALGEGTDRTFWSSETDRISEGSRWYEFDVTPLAQEWGRNPQMNYGMVLAAEAGDADANVEARFVSHEGSGDLRPQFVISYTLPAQ